MTDLDRIDRQILEELQNNARISNKELAARVHLAPSSCHARVQRLIDEEVLRGFHADVDPAALGVGLEAIVSVQLTGNPKNRLEKFLEHLESMREVVEFYEIAGRNDLLLHVAVRDVHHMRTVVMERLSSRPEVQQLESALIYRHRQTPGFPDLLDEGPDDR